MEEETNPEEDQISPEKLLYGYPEAHWRRLHEVALRAHAEGKRRRDFCDENNVSSWKWFYVCQVFDFQSPWKVQGKNKGRTGKHSKVPKNKQTQAPKGPYKPRVKSPSKNSPSNGHFVEFTPAVNGFSHSNSIEITFGNSVISVPKGDTEALKTILEVITEIKTEIK